MASEFMEQVYEALTGRSYAGPETGFPELLGRLVRVAGSGKAAARLIGVSDTTFYRWRSGRQAPKTGADTLARIVRRAELPPAVERDIRAKHRTMRVKAVWHVSRDVRTREINLGQAVPQRSTTLFVSAWLAATDDKAEDIWWRAVDKHIGADLEMEAIVNVEYR